MREYSYYLPHPSEELLLEIQVPNVVARIMMQFTQLNSGSLGKYMSFISVTMFIAKRIQQTS